MSCRAMPTICKQTLAGVLHEPAAAFVSGLPLFNKPLKMRLDLLDQAFGLMKPDAPFVQFTYNAISPIPRSHGRVRAEASGRVWRNFPPARVWVYRQSRHMIRHARSVFLRPHRSCEDDVCSENSGHPGLAAQRVLQRAAGRARDQGVDAGGSRRHPHLARRLSAADLRRRSASPSRGRRPTRSSSSSSSPRIAACSSRAPNTTPRSRRS